MSTSEEVAVYLRLKDEFGQPLENAKKDLEGFDEKVKETGDQTQISFTEMNQALQLVQQGIAMVGRVWSATGGAIISKARDIAEQAANIGNLAKSLGQTTDQIQELQHVANITDVSFQSLAKGMQIISRNAYDARDGTGEMAEAFAALGVTVEGTDGKLKPSAQLMDEVGAALGKMEDETQRTAVAMRLLGRSGGDLIPLFTDGEGAFRRLREEAHELGAVMSEESIKNFRDMKDEIQRMEASIDALIRVAVEPFIDDIKDMATGLREFVKEVTPAAEGVAMLTSDIVSLSFAVSDMFMPRIAALAKLGALIPGIGPGIQSVSLLMNALTGDSADGFFERYKRTRSMIMSLRSAGGAGGEAGGGGISLDPIGGSGDEEAAGVMGRPPPAYVAALDSELMEMTSRFYDEMDIKAEIARVRDEDREREKTEQRILRQEEYAASMLDALATTYSERMAVIDHWEERETEKVGEHEGAREKITREASRRRQGLAVQEKVAAIRAEAEKWGALNTIVSTFGDQQSEVLKGIRTVQAVINTHAAVTEILATPGLGTVTRFVMAGAALAQGFAQVRAIQSAGKGSSSGGSIGMGASGGGGASEPSQSAPGPIAAGEGQGQGRPIVMASIHVQGDVLDMDEFIRNKVRPGFQDAAGDGVDFGLQAVNSRGAA